MLPSLGSELREKDDKKKNPVCRYRDTTQRRVLNTIRARTAESRRRGALAHPAPPPSEKQIRHTHGASAGRAEAKKKSRSPKQDNAVRRRGPLPRPVSFRLGRPTFPPVSSDTSPTWNREPTSAAPATQPSMPHPQSRSTQTTASASHVSTSTSCRHPLHVPTPVCGPTTP